MKYTLQQLQDMAFKELQKNQLKYENQIIKTYHDALVQIQGQMKILYDRYATNGKLSLADLARYNRYTSMEKQIMDILSPAVKDSIKEIKHLLPEQYQESYYHYAWAIDNATGLRLNWGELNPAHIAKLFDIGDVKNIYYSEALKNYLPDAQKNIRKALMANLSMGKSFDTMAKDLRRALNITNYQGLRIARTESMTSINAGTDYAYQVAQQKGIEGKVYWDATLDMRTRPTHGQMDGAYKTDEGWILPDGTLTLGPGGYAAPYPGFEGLPAEERINCRCHIRYDIDGFSPQLRRTREQGIVPYQTYDQWSKERLK